MAVLASDSPCTGAVVCYYQEGVQLSWPIFVLGWYLYVGEWVFIMVFVTEITWLSWKISVGLPYRTYAHYTCIT